MCLSALIASIPLVLSKKGGAFLLPCGLAGLCVGFLILPSFIKEQGAEKLQFGTSIFGGILSVIAAIPIASLTGTGIIALTSGSQKSFGEMVGNIFVVAGAGVIFLGPIISIIAVPLGILGAIVTQIIWWKATRFNLNPTIKSKGKKYE